MTQPNLVLIFSDQQHWQALGFEDNTFVTPNLDRFANQSVVFERAFCTTPQCSPSRSSMFTGYYPSTTGVMGNVGAFGGPPLRQETLATNLQQAGYTTAYFGKWHLGKQAIATAGWDEEFGVTGPDTHDDAETTRRALHFLNTHRADSQPFTLVLSYEDPHDVYHFDTEADPVAPLTPLPETWYQQAFEQVPDVQQRFMTEDQGTKIHGHDAEHWQAYHAWYVEKVRLYDRFVGQILDALEESGQAENTVVIITSDHGDMDTHHRLIFKGPFMYEHMMRVPFMARVPQAMGGIPAVCNHNSDVVCVDITPTLLDFAGADIPECDGISLKPYLIGQSPAPKRDFVIGQYHGKQRWVNPIRMLRTGNYKYTRYLHQGEELYDLIQDPQETLNLALSPAYGNIKHALSLELDAWMAAHNDPFKTLTLTERDGSPISFATGNN